MNLCYQWLAVSLNLCRSAESDQFGRIADRRSVNQREIAGVRQSEDIEDMFLGIFIKLFSGDSFQDPLQCDEVQAAVHEIGAGTEVSLDLGGDVPLHLLWIVSAIFLDECVGVDVRRQSGRV